jgi:hypothetical protein
LKILKTVSLVGAIAVLAAGSSSAAVVTSVAGGNVIPMPAINAFGGAPQTFGPGITWSSTNFSSQGGSVFGYNGGYGFAGNGFWNGNPPMAGLNDSFDAYGVVDTMTFAFASPVKGVGGILNWVPNQSPVTMSVFDSAMNLIESVVLSVGGSNSQTPFAFLGFLEGTANISFLTLSDGYVAIRDLTVVSSVPVPAALPLFATAIGGFFASRKLRRKAKTA